jgi:hypothetical protein
VVRFRRGLDSRSIPPIRVAGDQTRADRSAFLSTLSQVLADRHPERKVHAMFCDSAYGAPYVERLRSMAYSNVHEVNFGATETPDQAHYANMRAYIWGRMREWLLVGAIPADDSRLESDLAGPGHHLDRRDRLVLESKEDMADRGVASPDDADALALTFAAHVAPRRPRHVPTSHGRFTGRSGSGSAGGTGLGWLS